MKKIRYTFIIALVACLCVACGEGNLDMLGLVYTKSDSVNKRFDQSMEYNATHPYDTIMLAEDDYHFYAMSDIHVDFTADNLDEFIEHYKSDATAAPFCLCLGDFINATKHYNFCMHHLSQIGSLEPQHQAGRRDTCYGSLGNHDIYYKQWFEYARFYPTATYCFVVKTPSAKDLYICLDTADGTIGTKQMAWLRDLLKGASEENYRHIICFTHTHSFKKDGSQGHTSNMPLEETYELANILSTYGVELIIQGHAHHRDLTKFKGVDFLRIDALEDHYYNAFYNIFYIGEDYYWKVIPVGPQNPDVEQTRIPGVPC